MLYSVQFPFLACFIYGARPMQNMLHTVNSHNIKTFVWIHIKSIQNDEDHINKSYELNNALLTPENVDYVNTAKNQSTATVNEKRKPLSRIKWKDNHHTKQSRDTASHDAYFMNLFCKVLHYVDTRYPLFWRATAFERLGKVALQVVVFRPFLTFILKFHSCLFISLQSNCFINNRC